MSTVTPKRALTVTVCGPDGRAARAPGLARWLVSVAPRAWRGSVTVVLVSDRRMRTLNRVWRSVDRATDVLSFPMAKSSRRSGGRGREPRTAVPPHIGDIVIATGVAERQAREAGHSLTTELRVLALHGLLHVVGYDHTRDAGAMARMERRLRGRGGLPLGLIERGGST
ncbi:MAG: rRNA maturation RNase YbeY [Luteitalea sp.]|nr:rRNA maturation RNase YbeY [Luteitalea sp.]